MWEILEISPTNNLKEIRKAYAQKLRKIDPTSQPQDFQSLKRAFDSAIAWAKSQKTPENQPPVLNFPKEKVSQNQETSRKELDWNLPKKSITSEGKTPKNHESGGKELDWNLPNKSIISEGERPKNQEISQEDLDWELPISETMSNQTERMLPTLSQPIKKNQKLKSSYRKYALSEKINLCCLIALSLFFSGYMLWQVNHFFLYPPADGISSNIGILTIFFIILAVQVFPLGRFSRLVFVRLRKYTDVIVGIIILLFFSFLFELSFFAFKDFGSLFWLGRLLAVSVLLAFVIFMILVAAGYAKGGEKQRSSTIKSFLVILIVVILHFITVFLGR